MRINCFSLSAEEKEALEKFSPRGGGLSFYGEGGGRRSHLPPPWCFFLLALLAMEVLFSLLVDPGEFLFSLALSLVELISS